LIWNDREVRAERWGPGDLHIIRLFTATEKRDYLGFIESGLPVEMGAFEEGIKLPEYAVLIKRRWQDLEITKFPNLLSSIHIWVMLVVDTKSLLTFN
jgi:hypothetical protein